MFKFHPLGSGQVVHCHTSCVVRASFLRARADDHAIRGLKSCGDVCVCSTLSAVNTNMPGSFGHRAPFEGADRLPDQVGREGPHRPPPLWEELQLTRATFRASSNAEYWLGRLEQAADRLTNRRTLVRVTQARETSAALNDAQVVLALPEIMATDLPAVTVRNPVDPTVLRFLRADDDAVDHVLRGEHVGHVE